MESPDVVYCLAADGMLHETEYQTMKQQGALLEDKLHHSEESFSLLVPYFYMAEA